MAFPLGTVLSAAPSVISAAADIIRVIKENKSKPEPEAQPTSEQLQALNNLIERQAQVIEELAQNNRNLALAVRNNRILSAVAIITALAAVAIAV
ncbi:MAG: hypothetical protein PVG89_14610 [Gammaproteobacteria bacterium]|jgi:hypothetical protein